MAMSDGRAREQLVQDYFPFLAADAAEEMEDLLGQMLTQVGAAGVAELEDILRDADAGSKLEMLKTVVRDIRGGGAMPSPGDIGQSRLKAKEAEKEKLLASLAELEGQEKELRGKLDVSRGLVDEKVGKLEDIQQEVQRVLDASKVWEGRAVLDVFKQGGGNLSN